VTPSALRRYAAGEVVGKEERVLRQMEALVS